MQFDDLVQQLLEYWNRNYSDAGNIAQLPKVPKIAQPLVPGDLFPQAALERSNKHGKRRSFTTQRKEEAKKRRQ